MSLLDQIVSGAREDVATRRAKLPTEELEARARDMGPVPSLAAALHAGEGPRVIAEIKRASPTRGPIRPDLDPVDIARTYEQHGAVGISCLTEGRRFGGSLEDLAAVAKAVRIPVLRKDFTVDRHQLLEARVAGAAAVLLIVRILDQPLLEDLHAEAHELGLDALIEIHDEAEAMRVHAIQPRIVGVNNRNLDSLKISLETSRRLAAYVPAGAARISESGITRPADIASLEAFGYHGFLVGEHLMRAPEPGAALAHLLTDPRRVR